MKRIYKILILIIVVLTSISALFGQERNLDSLKKTTFTQEIHPIKKINNIILISELELETYSKTSLDTLLLVEALLKKLPSSKQKSLLEGRFKSAVGLYYDFNGQLDKAVSYYYQALKMAEKYNDTVEVAKNYNNLGYVFDMQGQYLKAKDAYSKSLKIKRSINDSLGMSHVINNIAFIFKELEIYDSSQIYFNQCLSIQKKMNDQEGLAVTYNNLGLVFEKLGYNKKAMIYYKKSLEMEIKFNKPLNIGLSYITVGTNYILQEKFDSAFIYLSKADSIAEILQNLEIKLSVKRNLSKYYSSVGDYKMSLNCFMQYTEIKDSLINVRSNENIIEMETKYETDKKQAEILLLNKNKELNDAKINQQQIIGFVFAIVILALLTVAFFIYKSLKQKRKANSLLEEQKKIIVEANEVLYQQNEEITSQRDEIERNRIILEIKNSEVQKSIEAAERIQTAFFQDEESEKVLLPPHFILFKPRNVVSGDFYWSHFIDDYLYISVVDCTGHGVPGALMSMLALSIIKDIFKENKLYHPGEVLTILREKVIKELKQKHNDGNIKEGMDMSLVRLNTKTNELEFAGANNPLYVFSGNGNNEIEILKPNKETISLSQRMNPFSTQKIVVNKNDQIFLFSDGFADQFGGPNNKKIGYKQFREILVNNAHLDLELQKEELDSFFKQWKNIEEQIDDVCIISVRI